MVHLMRARRMFELIGAYVLGLLVVTLLLAACSQQVPGQVVTPGIKVWHDDARHVTCWLVDGGGGERAPITCLPDAEVAR